MKPLKHTNKVRVCTYLKPDCQALIDNLALEINKTVSVAIALIVEQHRLIADQFPSVIYQISLERVDRLPMETKLNRSADNSGYKLYQIYMDQDLANYVKEIADTKNLSESEAIDNIIREWHLINSKYQ